MAGLDIVFNAVAISTIVVGTTCAERNSKKIHCGSGNRENRFPLIILHIKTLIHSATAPEYPQRMDIPSLDISASSPRQSGA